MTDLEDEGLRRLQILVQLVACRHGVRSRLREDHEAAAFLFGELVDVVPGGGDTDDADAWHGGGGCSEYCKGGDQAADSDDND
jgi:hypothetical protein